MNPNTAELKRTLKFIAFVFIFTFYFAFPQGLYHPFNMDFEDGEPGKLPKGWVVPGYAINLGYSATSTALNPHGGKLCAELGRDLIDVKEGKYGSLMQVIDASPYRGKMIRFRAWVRAEISGTNGSAHLWLREHFSDNHAGLFDMMEERPIVVNNWQVYEITGRIDDDASYINYGLLLKGSGKAWIDDASFEVVDKEEAGIEPPKPLKPEAIENLVVFAKLFGDIRYFYPSNEARELDWDRFALTGVEALEKSTTNDNLIETLNNLFLPIAPALKLYNATKPEKLDPMKPPKNAIDKIALAWKHIGPPHVRDSKIFMSSVDNIYKSQRDKDGYVFQIIDATPLQGKKIRLSSYVRTSVVKPFGAGLLGIRIDKDEEQPILELTNNDEPITYDDWKEYSITAIVPANAKMLRIGLILNGEGGSLFDDIKLSVIEGGKENKIDIRNPGFEDSDIGRIARGWIFNNSSEKAGYEANVVKGPQNSGLKCLAINSDARDRVQYPEPGEYYSGSLNDNIQFNMPLTLFVDSSHTLPYPSATAKDMKCSKPEKFDLTAKDRTSRLAIVVGMWNMMVQFNLFNDNEEVWDRALRTALAKAAIDKDQTAFLETLQILQSNLNDAQARVWHGDDQYRYGLPFLWKWVNGKLVVLQTYKDYNDLKPGDIVTEIEGIPAQKYIEKAETRISGSSSGWKKLRALAEIRAGKENSTLKIKVKTDNNVEKNVDVLRYVTLSELTEKRPPEVSIFNNSIYYIDLTRINDKIFKSILDTIKNASAIIFDLRGVSLTSEHALGLFAKESMKSPEWQIPVYTKPNHSVLSYKYISGEIKGRNKFPNIKTVFLTDERTIGYSESIVSIIKQYKLGEVIGSKTAGTCGELAGIKLPGNYNFSWTIIKCLDYNGGIIQNGGISPTFPVEPSIDGIRMGKDEIFEKAVELLTK